MIKQLKYKIPDEYFFRLHHVRPRFKSDVEEVLLYVATSISEMSVLAESEFNSELNKVLFNFKGNLTSKKKTIDNWRTEISALFAFIQKESGEFTPSKTAIRLANNQYLDEFFNYFLYAFQYPAGHIKPQNVIKQIKAGIKFKPCVFILKLLIEGEKLTGKPFSLTAEELTQCAYFDLRVTRDGKPPEDVAKLILDNRSVKLEYEYKYDQLKNEATSKYPSSGDVYRYAGDILDYMVLANLLQTKGTGHYYYLNKKNKVATDFHLNYPIWFDGYDKFYNQAIITNQEISEIEESWFNYASAVDNIEEFLPHLDRVEEENLNNLIQEYYSQMSVDRKVPTKIIGDYGESLILAHEYLRTMGKSNRQHLINKIPTPLGVGYDIQSVEFQNKKRYIEVKTTKSRKAININRFKLTPNEWDTAETLGENYFIYYLVVNSSNKRIFVIQNPLKQRDIGNIKVDNNFVVEFKEESGQWQKLLKIIN
ncbi:MAG: DUF3883 domain-containing protein [Pseudomonadota bacterium]